ncbi:MAG: class I SAM-dependent methyltransferase [Nanoarchaeota archaeon]
MIIRFNKDLSKEEVWANGVELASIMGHDRSKGQRIITYLEDKKVPVHQFKNPVLVTDNHRIARLSPSLRDTLFSLFSRSKRIVEYNGISTYSDDSHVNVWSPSIDTLLFAKALRGVLKKGPFASGVEIGCGSGFLSKYVLMKHNKLKSFLVIDLNPYAIKCAMDNIKDSRAVFYTGDGWKKIQNQRFDLMICNPPYVPRPKSIDDNPYEGVGLLNHLIHEGEKYLNPKGVLVVNVSSLCQDIVFRKKLKMKMKVLAKMTVPLKVNNILNNKAWLNYLLKKRHLKKQHKDGYDYWHTISVIQLER